MDLWRCSTKKSRQLVSFDFFSLYFDKAIFLVLDDENLEQVLANILQVKERGATVIVLTNMSDIYSHVKPEKIDYLIQLVPQKSLLSAMICVVPLLMICYYTALAKGINPDEQIIMAMNINSELIGEVE